jgi:hypothetical protein
MRLPDESSFCDRASRSCAAVMSASERATCEAVVTRPMR